MDRRKGLRRDTPKSREWQRKRRKPINPMSEKRKAEATERLGVLAEVRQRDGGTCWAIGRLAHTCSGPLDGHELVLRAQYPGGHLDASNVRLLCRYAHDWAHDHAGEAYELGLLVHPWDREQ